MRVQIPFVYDTRCITVRVNIICSADVSDVVAPTREDAQLIYLGKRSYGKQETHEEKYNIFHHKKWFANIKKPFGFDRIKRCFLINRNL